MMPTHKIAILSDTHGLLRPEVREALKGCEHILHAGDIADRKTCDDIACIAPATFVWGNADILNAIRQSKTWDDIHRDRCNLLIFEKEQL